MDLLKTNRKFREFIRGKAVYIHGSSVNLMHEFVYMPLVYSKRTEMSMQSEKGKNRADDPVANHFCSRFQEYNLLVLKENKQNYVTQSAHLPAPCRMLAVKKVSLSWRIFGEDYSCTKDVFARISSLWLSPA